jgi:hypothetical protein
MAAQDVEVIKLAGSCEPRACGPTHSTQPETATSADEQEFPVEPQQMMTPQEKDEARVLQRRIGKYKSLFPQETADFNQGTLDSLSIEELRNKAKDVEYVVATRRSSKAIRGLFLGGLASTELVAGPILGLELQGLAGFASRSEDLMQTVDEVGVKYGDQLYVDPLIRLSMGMMQLAMAVDAHNRAAKSATDAPTPTP